MSNQGTCWVEMRRHSVRDDAGNVSEAGKALVARALKASVGTYAVGCTSGKPRAVETAKLFGLADPQTDDRLAMMVMQEPFERQARSLAEKKNISMLEAYFSIPGCRTQLRDTGKKALELVMETAARLKGGERALLVSHGGTVEPAALLGLQQEFSLSLLGGELGECEGVTFAVADGQILQVDVNRLVTVEA